MLTSHTIPFTFEPRVEFEAHRAFAFALKEDVLKPLQVLNATETRIANRIRDDVRSSHEVSRYPLTFIL
jgi:hypothetical protein